MLPDGLVDASSEANISVEDVHVCALLDTGATVSVMSQSFYEKNLLHIPLEPLDNMLDIECAGGDQLPYLGYVQVRVASSGCGVEGKGRCCFLLVVPNTKYNEWVPVISSSTTEYHSDCLMHLPHISV